MSSADALRYAPRLTISAFGDKVPRFGPDVFVHVDATIIGDVVLEEGVNVWPGAVLRGDVERIVIGAFTSFQDGAVAHADPGFPVSIDPYCIVGHGAIVHGATVGAGSLIGMHATLLNGCQIGEGCVVAAQALAPEGREFAERRLLIGSPARALRELTAEDVAPVRAGAERYSERGRLCVEQGMGADLSTFPWLGG